MSHSDAYEPILTWDPAPFALSRIPTSTTAHILWNPIHLFALFFVGTLFTSPFFFYLWHLPLHIINTFPLLSLFLAFKQGHVLTIIISQIFFSSHFSSLFPFNFLSFSPFSPYHYHDQLDQEKHSIFLVFHHHHHRDTNRDRNCLYGWLQASTWPPHFRVGPHQCN